MSVEQTAASIIAKVGLWWPLAEEDQLRQASSAYQDVSTAVLAAAATGSAGAALVSGGNRGKGITSLAEHWAIYDGGPAAGLPATAQAASDVAAALSAFADKVVEAKHKIINLAIEIGATLAVGAGLALFTLGGSAAAAAARTAVLVARGVLIGRGLSAVAATIVTGMLTGAALGAVEGFVGSIVAQIGKMALSDGHGISSSEAMRWTGVGAGAGAVLAPAGAGLAAGWRALRHTRNASPVVADTVGDLYKSLRPYKGDAHHREVLDFAQLTERLSRTNVGDLIEVGTPLRAARGQAPLVTGKLADRTVHTTITTTSGRIIKRGGAHPIVIPPGSKLLVVSREYVKDSGHFIHLEDVSHLDEVELFVRRIPQGL